MPALIAPVRSKCRRGDTIRFALDFETDTFTVEEIRGDSVYFSATDDEPNPLSDMFEGFPGEVETGDIHVDIDGTDDGSVICTLGPGERIGRPHLTRCYYCDFCRELLRGPLDVSLRRLGLPLCLPRFGELPLLSEDPAHGGQRDRQIMVVS
jgi:hypothetical protein